MRLYKMHTNKTKQVVRMGRCRILGVWTIIIKFSDVSSDHLYIYSEFRSK